MKAHSDKTTKYLDANDYLQRLAKLIDASKINTKKDYNDAIKKLKKKLQNNIKNNNFTSKSEKMEAIYFLNTYLIK